MELPPRDKFQIVILIPIVVRTNIQVPNADFILEQLGFRISKFEIE